MSTDVTTKLLTTEEVAELLQVSPELVRQWRSRGEGPRSYKLSPGRSGTVRYRREDVDAWLRTRWVPPATAGGSEEGQR